MANYRGEDYKCGACGVDDVKLWREYQTFLEHTSLRCAMCASEEQDKSPHTSWKGQMLFADGDQIGWMVPAVPTPEGDTFWGYTSVPEEDVDWWYARPTYHKNLLLEIACLQNLLTKARGQARYYSKLWLEERNKT